jgi:hypothetical protein
MSNLRRMLQGGKTPGEKPVPGAPVVREVPPLHEEALDGRTKAHDCAAVAKAAEEGREDEKTGIFVPKDGDSTGAPQAASPDDDEGPTKEVAVPGPQAPAFGPLPPIAMPPPRPAAAPEPVAAQPPVATSRPPPPPRREKPVVPPAAAPAASAKQEGDLEGVLAKFQGLLDTALAPIKAQLTKLEEAVAQNDEIIGDVVEAVDGDDPKASLSGIVATLGETVATLQRQLFGEKPEEALAQFGGEPVVPALYGEVMEIGDRVEDLTGKDGERIPSMVRANANLTAKTLVIEMLKQAPDTATIRRAAIEGGPDTAKDVLSALATDEAFALEVVGSLYLAPAESLDDPKNTTLKASVVTYAKGVAARAQYYIEQLDWDVMGNEAAAGRAPASDTGAQGQQEGGDS